MNIFFLDEDPRIAATYHHDRHVLKMIVESAQLLCSVHHLNPKSTLDKNRLYKLTHKNHPMACWVRECPDNYYWLGCLAKFLCEEYTYRFSKIHKTANLVAYLRTSCDHLFSPATRPTIQFDNFLITEPPLCMPPVFQIGDTVASYRDYYYYEKRFNKNGQPMDKYTVRSRPPFLI
jgi:hypothetical protein